MSEGAPGQIPVEETWAPADGSDGVAYLEFDDHGVAQVTRECLTMLLGRAGFVRVDRP